MRIEEKKKVEDSFISLLLCFVCCCCCWVRQWQSEKGSISNLARVSRETFHREQQRSLTAISDEGKTFRDIVCTEWEIEKPLLGRFLCNINGEKSVWKCSIHSLAYKPLKVEHKILRISFVALWKVYLATQRLHQLKKNRNKLTNSIIRAKHFPEFPRHFHVSSLSVLLNNPSTFDKQKAFTIPTGSRVKLLAA